MLYIFGIYSCELIKRYSLTNRTSLTGIYTDDGLEQVFAQTIGSRLLQVCVKATHDL